MTLLFLISPVIFHTLQQVLLLPAGVFVQEKKKSVIGLNSVQLDFVPCFAS